MTRTRKSLRGGLIPNGDQQIPTLKSIQSSMSDYEYGYLYHILRRIAFGDIHRAFTDDSQTDTFFFFELPQIVHLMQTEINNIHNTYGSGTYHFRIESAPKIIAELNKYILYFKQNADEFGRVNTDVHEALFS
jgi:hypothetical protein